MACLQCRQTQWQDIFAHDLLYFDYTESQKNLET